MMAHLRPVPVFRAHLTLITGGSRSGKSAFALHLAEDLPGPRTFVATCPRIDAEMDARIARHRAEREGRGWKTVEAPVDLAGALRTVADDHAVVVDCLTLWVNNLMYEAEQKGEYLEEDGLGALCCGVLDAAAARSHPVVFVTNEVGMGIVPDNALARQYRDLVGRCNQMVAARADRVVMMVSGLPVDVKGNA